MADKTLPPHLVWSHGWSLHPNYWSKIVKVFEHTHPHLEHTLWNWGYYTDAPLATPIPSGDFLLVGHSLGFIKGLQYLAQQNVEPVGAVCLQGFLWYCPPKPGLPGVSHDIVATLAQNVEKHPLAALGQFAQQAQIHWPVPGTPNQQRLQEDLDLLSNGYLKNWPTCPVLALCSADDAIVPATLTRYQAKGTANVAVKRLPKGGHALGHAHAKEVANEITQWWANHG